MQRMRFISLLGLLALLSGYLLPSPIRAKEDQIPLQIQQEIDPAVCDLTSYQEEQIKVSDHFVLLIDSSLLDSEGNIDLNGLDITDYTEALDFVYEQETKHWPAPPVINQGRAKPEWLDKPLVYIGRETSGYGRVVPNDADDTRFGAFVGRIDQASAAIATCMLLSHDYPQFADQYNETLAAQDYLKAAIAHEFHHMIQLGMGDNEPFAGDLWFESTSMYMEEQIYDEVNATHIYGYPIIDMALGDKEKNRIDNKYRQWLMLQYAHEHYGGLATIQNLWAGIAAGQSGLSSFRDSLGGEAAFNQFYHNYAISTRFMKNCGVADSYCFDEGADYQQRMQESSLEPLLDHGRLMNRDSVSFNLNDHYASKWISVPHTEEYKLSFERTAGTGQFKASIVTDLGGSLDVQSLTLNANSKGELDYVPPAGAKQAILVVSNVAAPQLSSVDDLVTLTESTFSVRISGQVAFLIDTTGSMADNLSEVKAAVNGIVDNPPANLNVSSYHLTTFKDEVDYQGSFDAQSFKAQIDALETGGGGDCPENLLGALQETAQHTWNTTFYIHSDAGFFGGYRELMETAQLLLSRFIRINYLFTVDCSDQGSRAAAGLIQADQQTKADHRSLAPNTLGSEIMGRNEAQLLTELTGGMFLPIQSNEISAATRLALTTSQLSNAATYLRRSITQPTTATIPIDSSVNTLHVLNTSFSGNTNLALTNPTNQLVTSPEATLTQLSKLQAYTIDNPATGVWSTQLNGTGTSAMHVWVESPLQLVVHQPTLLTYQQTNTIHFEVVGQVLTPTFQLQRVDGSLVTVLDADDDGQHNDGFANDRIFTAPYYSASDEPLWLVLTGWNTANEPIQRIAAQPLSAIKPFKINLPSEPITTEEGQSILIPVTFNQSQTNPITVSYTIHEGTATIDSDFQAISGTLVFEPGATSKPIAVSILDDAILEADESFSVQITQALTTTIGTAAVSVTIRANDRIDLSAQPIVTNEGRSVLVPVTRSEINQPLTVDYSTQAGSAQASSDFVAQSGTLNFPIGMASQNIEIAILDDTLAENSEFFTVTLANSSNQQIGIDQTTITIQANDQVSMQESSYLATEGHAAKVKLQLNSPATQPVSVMYSINDGSALSGNDYYPPSGPVTFSPGEIEAIIDIYIQDDSTYEGDETFSITLTDVENAQLGTSITSVVTIGINDELALTPYAPLYLDEWQGLVELPVTLVQPRAITVSVDYRTPVFNGPNAATALLDYTPITGTLIFPPHTTVQTLTLPIIDDGQAESNERLFILLENPLNATAVGATELVITSNDTVQLASTTTKVSELATSQVLILLSMNAPSSKPVTLTYQTGDGTALAGQDYVSQSGFITIPPLTYESATYLSLPIIDDSEIEGNETFTIVISNPSNAELGTRQTLTVTIEANDAPIPTTTPLPNNSVLFVTGDPATTADTIVIDRLQQQLGLNVIVKDHNSVTAADASNGIQLVLISASVSSTKIGSMFRTSPIPVMLWENALFDDMQMTGSSNGSDFGVTAIGTQITIANSAHPLAAGLSGSINIHASAQSMSYGGNLPPSAINIAYATGTPNKRVIWGYESGASMVGLTAPARRVGLFLGDLSAEQLTPQGWQLFDAAVIWAISPPNPATPTPTIGATATPTIVVPTATSTTVLPTSTPAGGMILLVAGSTSLNPSDSIIKGMLEARGYTVLVKKDSDAQSTDAIGKTLIVVSSTVTSGNVTTKFLNSNVPVLIWEMALFDDMKLTGATVGQDQGTTENVSTSTIVNGSHPLAGGLSGLVTLTTNAQSFSFGEPNSHAAIIARAGGANRSVIFGYEACAILKDGITQAPARRVGLFLNDHTAATLTADGTTLVNAAITWALAGNPCVNGATATPTAGTTPTPTSTATVVQPTATNTPTNTPMPTSTATPSATSKTALFVVNNASSLNAGDTAVKTRLEALGYSVTALSAATAATGDATGKTLVLISSSVPASNVNTKFKSVTVPVIVWEYAIYDDMAMTNTTSGTDFGYSTGTQMVITTANHQLAGGLSGTINIYSSTANIPFGLPNANAISIGVPTNTGTNKLYFAYDQNTAMIGGFSVNARRVGLFWTDTVTPTNDAWTLFDAAVNWATTP